MKVHFDMLLQPDDLVSLSKRVDPKCSDCTCISIEEAPYYPPARKRVAREEISTVVTETTVEA
jgi:hypothetical protein